MLPQFHLCILNEQIEKQGCKSKLRPMLEKLRV